MNKVLFFLAFFLTQLPVWSQNVIKVRSQHYKELIHIMKNETFLGRGESKIYIKNDGTNYEFLTRNSTTNQYTTYRNGKKLGEFSYPFLSDENAWQTSTKQGGKNLYTLHLKNGQKYGPYEFIQTQYSLDNSVLNGFYYSEKEKYYYKDFILNKTHGPYDEIYVYATEKSNLTYEYKVKDQKYFFHNGTTYGPYDQINYYNSKNYPFTFTFRNKEGKWQVFYKTELKDQFENSPYITIFENDKVLLNGKVSGDPEDTRSYLIDGEKYLNEYNKNGVSHNSFGDVLELRTKENENYYSTEIYKKGTLLGKYKIDDMYSDNCKKTNFYNMVLFDSINPTTDNYSVLDNTNKKVFVGTNKELEIRNLFLIGTDIIYIRSKDSCLIINGKETEHKKVTHLDYTSYPDSYYMIKTVDHYDIIYKNGKEMTEEELKKSKFSPSWYSLKYEEFREEYEDGKKYIYLKNSTKRIGPVASGSTIMFTSDKKHYAESDDRRMQIFLDGKMISEGFGIAYNAKTNSFHWFSIDGKNMYLHTYQNN